MLPALLVAFASFCQPTIVQDISGEGWNRLDQQSFRSAQGRCVALYENSPCLASFRKNAFNDYRAICGRPTPSVDARAAEQNPSVLSRRFL